MDFIQRVFGSPGTLAGDHVLRQTVTPYAALSPLYDALLGDRFFPQLRRTFERLVQRHGIQFFSVVDVACGTGTFVRYLRERGVPIVYGVDGSPGMLCLAIVKNQGNGARFLLQDFATLQLPQPVDLITCHFDSLNYLLTTRDLLHALRRFRANLNTAGHLIFDMITEQPSWQGRGPRVERVIDPGGITVVRVTRWDPRRCIQTAVLSISSDARLQREVHLQRGYPVAVVAGLLGQAGFALVGAHDFQTLGSPAASSARLIYVARK